MIFSNKTVPLLAMINRWKNGTYPSSKNPIRLYYNYDLDKDEVLQAIHHDHNVIKDIAFDCEVLSFSNKITRGILDREINMLNNQNWFSPCKKMIGNYIILIDNTVQLLYACVFEDGLYKIAVYICQGPSFLGGINVNIDEKGDPTAFYGLICLMD